MFLMVGHFKSKDFFLKLWHMTYQQCVFKFTIFWSAGIAQGQSGCPIYKSWVLAVVARGSISYLSFTLIKRQKKISKKITIYYLKECNMYFLTLINVLQMWWWIGNLHSGDQNYWTLWIGKEKARDAERERECKTDKIWMQPFSF